MLPGKTPLDLYPTPKVFSVIWLKTSYVYSNNDIWTMYIILQNGKYMIIWSFCDHTVGPLTWQLFTYIRLCHLVCASKPLWSGGRTMLLWHWWLGSSQASMGASGSDGHHSSQQHPAPASIRVSQNSTWITRHGFETLTQKHTSPLSTQFWPLKIW